MKPEIYEPKARLFVVRTSQKPLMRRKKGISDEANKLVPLAGADERIQNRRPTLQSENKILGGKKYVLYKVR
jgi:hypothetical protein